MEGCMGRISKADRNVLSARRVATIKEPGLYADGGNLYLQITKLGHRSWIFRYRSALKGGKLAHMGLGPLTDVSLSDARVSAKHCRAMLREGLDPIQERRRKRAEIQLESARIITFKECCEAYITAHRPSWTNEKHAQQWETTLKTYAYPVLGSLQVGVVELPHVLNVLEPIWNQKRETARRLRARIERVLAWAETRGYREGSNPAAWAVLKHLLAAENRAKPTNHLAALPYHQIHELIAKLHNTHGVAPLALEFTILTACRTNEALQATWTEFDIERQEWTIPAQRMKSGHSHRIPLAKRTLEILEHLRGFGSTCVFPGRHRDGKRPLSNMAMLSVLKRIGYDNYTVHGFRSTFRDWAAEQTSFPHEVAEMALAHTIKNKAEAAYRRGDLFERRRRLMEQWAIFVGRKPASTTVSLMRQAN